MLLARDSVGKAKPSTRTLPDQQFSFGKPELFEDRETVAKGNDLDLMCLFIFVAT